MSWLSNERNHHDSHTVQVLHILTITELHVLFAGTMFMISIVPGMNVMLVISQSIDGGLRKALAGVAGIAFGNLVFVTISVFGLGTLFLQFPEAFQLLKFTGVAFLLFGVIAQMRKAFLGVKEDSIIPAEKSQYFLQGVFTIVLNPKAFIFWIAVVPGFIDPDGQVALEVITLGIISIVVDTGVLVFYASLAKFFRPFIKNRFRRVRYVISALVLSMIAVIMLLL